MNIRTKRNQIIIGSIVLILVISVSLFLLPIINPIPQLVARANAEADANAERLQQPDQITTVMCGVASPLARRAPQTCTAIFVNGQFLVFDTGTDTYTSMLELMLPIEEIDAVFITHFHNDHYADLGEVIEWSWILGREHILPVVGPTGITQIVEGFEAAYELEASYRTAHHGADLMPPEWLPTDPIEFAVPEGDSSLVVYENDGVVVKAFRANHEPVEPAVGYIVEYSDQTIVISGDTVVTSALLENSRNADLLVAEAMNMNAVEEIENALRDIGETERAILMYDIRDYHMDVTDVGELASEADVKRLVLNHLAPYPNSDRTRRLLFENPDEEVYDGDLYVGEVGMEIIFSLDGEDINDFDPIILIGIFVAIGIITALAFWYWKYRNKSPKENEE